MKIKIENLRKNENEQKFSIRPLHRVHPRGPAKLELAHFLKKITAFFWEGGHFVSVVRRICMKPTSNMAAKRKNENMVNKFFLAMFFSNVLSIARKIA